MMLPSNAVDRVLGYRRETTTRFIALGLVESGRLTTAKKGEVSVIYDTAGEKKSVARESTGFEHSSRGSTHQN
jgi:hypothetical protein